MRNEELLTDLDTDYKHRFCILGCHHWLIQNSGQKVSELRTLNSVKSFFCFPSPVSSFPLKVRG